MASAEQSDEKLDQLIKLMGFQIVSGLETVAEKAKLLNRLGLSHSQIAAICGSSIKTVSARLTEKKKPKGKKK